MFNEDRPRYQIKTTTFEKLCNVIGYGLFSLAFIYLIISYFGMPSQIPTHINNGNVDETGPKYKALMMPLVIIPLIALLEFLEHKPHLHNYPPHLNEDNAVQMYTHSAQLINYIKNLVLIFFAYITYQFTKLALGGPNNLQEVVVIVIIAAIFTTIIYKFVRIYKTR